MRRRQPEETHVQNLLRLLAQELNPNVEAPVALIRIRIQISWKPHPLQISPALIRVGHKPHPDPPARAIQQTQ